MMFGRKKKATGANEKPAGPGQAFMDSLIMMVDDEPLAIEMTRLHLEDAGYTRFVSTTDPAETLGLLVSNKPDVLLLDVIMPGISGLELLARMEASAILKDVPTIIVTASRDSTTKLRALKLGATEFLNKPLDPSELVLRVRNTLAAKAYWQGCWNGAANRKVQA